MQEQLISPVRRFYNACALIILAITVIGAIPLGFCEDLVGFFLVYFVVYVSLVVISIIIMCICFPVVRKKEIEFFKNKYSLVNMEQNIDFNLNKEDFVFYANDRYIEFTQSGIKDMLTQEEHFYKSFAIFATYRCDFAGEIYKIFINFEADDFSFSLKLNNKLFSIIKFYKIYVDKLEDVLTHCESNLDAFFRSKKLQKQAIKLSIDDEFNKIYQPILKLFADKAYCSDNYIFFVKFHDDFIIKYDYKEEKMYINETFYGDVEGEDLLEFLIEINNDEYYFIEYNKANFLRVPLYFKLLHKNETDINTIKKTANIVRIFDINNLIL